MLKTILHLTLLMPMILLMSCEKDININDEYKETCIVYGLINPNDSISYLRIQKGFLSDGNSLAAAQIQDSNQYPYKLNVMIKSGSHLISFDTITLKNKEEGPFFAPKTQLYYALTKGLLSPNDSAHLIIKNPRTNQETTSSSLLHDTEQISFTYPRYSITFERDLAIKFNSIKEVRIYEFVLRFHYMEQKPNDPESAVEHYFDWRFPDYTAINTLGGKEIVYHYHGDEFYAKLYENIPETSELERYYGPIELRVSTANNDYFIYATSNQASNGSFNDDVFYGNIENGLGIFAVRSNFEAFYNMDLYTKYKMKTLAGLNFKNGY